MGIIKQITDSDVNEVNWFEDDCNISAVEVIPSAASLLLTA